MKVVALFVFTILSIASAVRLGVDADTCFDFASRPIPCQTHRLAARETTAVSQCLEGAWLKTLYDTPLKKFEKLMKNPNRNGKVSGCNFTSSSCRDLARDGDLNGQFIDRFAPACQRRDFAINNAALFSRYPQDLRAFDLQFEDDLKDLCAKREKEPQETLCEAVKSFWTDYVFSLEPEIYEGYRNKSLPLTPPATMTTITVTAPPPGDATMIVGLPATMTVGPPMTTAISTVGPAISTVSSPLTFTFSSFVTSTVAGSAATTTAAAQR